MRVITATGDRVICSMTVKEFQSITGHSVTDTYGNVLWRDVENLTDKTFDLTKMKTFHENVEKLFLLKKNLKTRFDEINNEMTKLVFPFTSTESETKDKK